MKTLHKVALASASLLFTVTPAHMGSAQTAPYTLLETGQGFARIQDAINAVGGGTGTIRIASARLADCGVQDAGSITYTATVPGQSVFEGVACEGKAALVLRGRSARIEGLVFANINVADGNGAGIRLERGDLAVTQSWFRDSQQGILTADYPSGTVAIDKSTFTRLGTCEYSSGCAHSIYTGDYGAVTVIRSRFEEGRGGHYVKSRARRVAVLNSSFDDTGGRGTNYMIDLPDGATGRIAGNWMVQGRDKENHSAFIAVTAEGKEHNSDGLTVEDNNARFAPGVSRSSTFVADWSGDQLQIGANTLGDGLQRFERR